MNRYALWKYLVIAIAVLLGTVYTLPNFFGEAPAVQVSPGRSSAKVDLDTQGKVEDALKVAGLTPELISLENNSLRVRFDTTDQQLKAKDAIQRTLNTDAENPSYIVALNLIARTPTWLGSLRAAPMYLGLDLRGGSQLMLEVDFDYYIKEQITSLRDEVKNSFRNESVRVLPEIAGDKIVFSIADTEQVKLVKKLIKDLSGNIDINEKLVVGIYDLK